MSRYSALKAIINQDITTNGQGDITGAILNQVLKDMVDSLGAYYQFGGIATPTTNPGNPDQRVFYIATIAGTYTNFGTLTVPNGFSILKFDESWILETLDLSSYLNNIVADGVVDGTRISATTTTSDRKTPDAYSAGSVFTYYDSTNATTYYYVALTNGPAGTSCSDPTKFFATTSSTQAVYQAMLISSVIATEQQSFSPAQKEQAASNIGLGVVVKGDVPQSLSDIQQVQAQNNMVGKVYDTATFSGLGKKVFAKNIQTVGGVQMNVMTQAFFQDSQSQPLTNTIFVIQYDYTLTGNITLPAGSTLLFDGGSISGDGQQRTITCNATTIQAAPLHIFDNIVLAGTVTADLYLNNFVHSRDCVTSAGNVGRAIHVTGRCVIDEPMTVTTGFNIYGEDMYKTRIVLSDSYSGTIKSIFIFDPSTNTVNYTSFKNFGVSAIDYVFYRKQTTATSGSLQVADFHNLYFDSIVKSTFHLECYGVGCVSIKNCYFIGNTTTKPHFYFYGHWFNNNTFENCRVGGNCGGFLKATAIQTSGNNGEMNQNSFVGNWFELITLTSDATALIDMNSQYNFHVLNIERNYFERIYKSNGSTLATLYQLTANSAIVRNVNWKSNFTVNSFENLILYNSGAVGLEISGNGPNTAPQTITSSVNTLLDVTEFDNGFTITYNSSNVSVNKVNKLPSLVEFQRHFNHYFFYNDFIPANSNILVFLVPDGLTDTIYWSDVQIMYGNRRLQTGKVSGMGDGNYSFEKLHGATDQILVETASLTRGQIKITNVTSSPVQVKIGAVYCVL